MQAASEAQPLILAIETATSVGSIAVFQGETLLGSMEIRQQQRHAQLLMPMIEQLLKALDLRASSLAAIGVSKGPGSYTGLRVGVSTAKGLCFALNKPLLSISSLQALAGVQQELAQQLQARIVPMIDARRMEVYVARFDGSLQQTDEIRAQIVEEDTFTHWLDEGPTIFCGDGVAKCKAILEKHSHAKLLTQAFSSAQGMGTSLYASYKQQQFEDLVTFEPYYLKDFRATKAKDPLRHVRGRKGK